MGCGNTYRSDLIVPDSLWAIITPKPDVEGAGLLCPTCIMDRAQDMAGITVGFLSVGAEYPRSLKSFMFKDFEAPPDVGEIKRQFEAFCGPYVDISPMKWSE